jgi:hypothetical protein
MVDRDETIRFVNGEAQVHNNPTWRAARLLALAALGEPVLLCIRQEADMLRGPLNYFPWLYLTAALVAAGDYAAAAELFTVGPETTPVAFDDNNREHSFVLRLFINTALNPQAALGYLNRGLNNRYVSSIPERINFVRRAHLRGETVSGFQYTLHGGTYTVRLENWQRHYLHISKAQFDALNLTPLYGDTEYHFHFYGYDHTHWNMARNQIEIRRSVTPVNGLYRVTLHITLPPGYGGAFTVYDRIPSNMRFLPMQRQWQQGMFFFSVHPVQRQLVELDFFSAANGPRIRNVYYYVTPLFDGDMAAGTTYVANRWGHNPLWGMTRN